ncbi:AAA family ATPase [Bacillus sp. B15-48]|uniref:AAA family ATPase n=1 Tax=Bacillus sp. B15-48 TaxID=1548601 RepID=UPI00193ED09D|nr:AAA family ATPase [Bacillus sp. B15-48]
MRLIELHIYGYGKLENVKITKLENLQVFYGENEAGKSTIMSFIHSILFGFPTKQQAELRYEPKLNSKYGGLIKASFKDKGLVVIERVKGKAAGDVTVTLESGEIGGEELLTELLGGMDKNTFQGIFSFNLHGLQNIHQLKGDELGRYLFSAGALGTDKLLFAENQLHKEMEQRFKPGGKKPRLNEKLKELRQVHEALKKAETENDEYGELLTFKAEKTERLAELNRQLKDIEHRISRFKELDRVRANIIEENELQSKLAASGDLSFPTDGLVRLERLGEQKHRLQARLSWLEEQEKALEAEATRVKPDVDLLQNEAAVSTQLEAFPVYQQLSQEKDKLQIRVQELNDEISNINDQLHVQYTEDMIANVSTSLVVKDQADELQLKQQQLQARKRTLDESFQDEKMAMVELEKSAEFFQEKLLDDETRTKIEHQLSAYEKQKHLKDEYERIKDQLASLKIAKQLWQTSQKRQSGQMLMLGLVCLILIGTGIVNSQWILTGIGTVGLIFSLFMYFRSGQRSTELNVDFDENTFASLQKREQELKAQLKETTGFDSVFTRETLQADTENRRRFMDVSARLEQQTNRYERVIQAFEKWETERNQLNQKQAEMAESLLLPEESGNRNIYDAVLLVEKLKQLFREKARIEEQLAMLEVRKGEQATKFANIAERFLDHRTLPIEEIVVLLRKKLREEIDRQAKYREAVNKLSELREEHSQLKQEFAQIIAEETNLFTLAAVSDEEGFRLQAKRAEQISDWETRITNLSFQLDAANITAAEREAIYQGIKPSEELEQALGVLEACKQEQSQLHDQLAEIKHRMGLLEEGGLYGELLHKYEQLKDEFAEEAKEWAEFAVSKAVLAQTVETYKTEKLPKLLEKAADYLQLLTANEYKRIIPQQTGSGFLVERKDYLLFEANELSQATAEQVYVSLRLALTATLFSRYPFPIIIDDSFVNFDEKRTKRMIALLRSFSENQILYFTCHKHLLTQFHQGEIVKLAEKSEKLVI